MNHTEAQSTASTSSATSTSKTHCQRVLHNYPAGRSLALDCFRGIAIVAMILVNNPGSWSYVYAPLKHAAWHGYTPTDLIFPFFIFITGISLAFSQAAKREQPKQSLIRGAALRMLKLILLGWFLALFYYQFNQPDFSWVDDRLFQLRVFGVLQRIGIVYFLTFLVCLYCKTAMRAFAAFALLIIYCVAMFLFPDTSMGAPLLEGAFLEGNNFSAWLDTALVGKAHLYAQTTPFAYDPEGLWSTLPAVSTSLFGVLVGESLQRQSQLPKQVVFRLLVVGLLLVVLGHVMDLIVPINKALWTPSFVFISAGYALMLLAALIYFVDLKTYRLWTAPFIVFGANSIAFFMFSGILARLLLMLSIEGKSLKAILYDQLNIAMIGQYNASLLYAILMLAVSYWVMFMLYKRNIILKV
jgi:predicted acyltransferase